MFYLPENAIGTILFFLLLSRQRTLMFVMILIIPGEQKVSMNRQRPQVFQLLLLLAYILESAMVIDVFSSASSTIVSTQASMKKGK